MENNLSDLDILKFNLQEEQFPHFSDEDLNKLLIMYKDVNIASYEGCLIKAYSSSTSIGPDSITINEDYWLRRGRLFKAKASKSRRRNYKSMRRADEIV